MKHILAIVRPDLGVRGRKAHTAELEYLRLVYAITKMRRESKNAQGYFIVISESIPDYLKRWEHYYQARQSVELISALPNHVSYSARKTATDFSGIVTEALLDKASHQKSVIIQSIQNGILDETMCTLEPHVQRIKDENRFPLGIRWDYYGITAEASNIARPDFVSKFD